MITLNIVRHAPIYFANNVLETIRNRFHADGMYNSFSLGVKSTVEGIDSLDTLLGFISKSNKQHGLSWNSNLLSLIDS